MVEKKKCKILSNCWQTINKINVSKCHLLFSWLGVHFLFYSNLLATCIFSKCNIKKWIEHYRSETNENKTSLLSLASILSCNNDIWMKKTEFDRWSLKGIIFCFESGF